MSQLPDMMASSIFFDVAVFLLPSLVTGSRVMTIFLNKGLTRNPEIGNTSIWVLLNTWRLGWVRDIKLGRNVSNKMLLNTAKCQGNSFYCLWFIKGRPTEVWVPPTQIRVKWWSRYIKQVFAMFFGCICFHFLGIACEICVNFTASKVFVFEVFLVRIYPHSDWIQGDTSYFSVIFPNAGKYGSE